MTITISKKEGECEVCKKEMKGETTVVSKYPIQKEDNRGYYLTTDSRDKGLYICYSCWKTINKGITKAIIEKTDLEWEMI